MPVRSGNCDFCGVERQIGHSVTCKAQASPAGLFRYVPVDPGEEHRAPRVRCGRCGAVMRDYEAEAHFGACPDAPHGKAYVVVVVHDSGTTTVRDVYLNLEAATRAAALIGGHVSTVPLVAKDGA